MNPQQLETIAKAAQCADLLTSDLREAHRLACCDNAALDILLRDLLGEVRKISNRLAELGTCPAKPSSQAPRQRRYDVTHRTDERPGVATTLPDPVPNSPHTVLIPGSSIQESVNRTALEIPTSVIQNARGLLERTMRHAERDFTDDGIIVPTPDGHSIAFSSKSDLEDWLRGLFVQAVGDHLTTIRYVSTSQIDTSSIVEEVLEPYEQCLQTWFDGSDDDLEA